MKELSLRPSVVSPMTKGLTQLPKPVVAVGIDKLKICIPAGAIDANSAIEIKANFDELCAEGAKPLAQNAAFQRRIRKWIAGHPIVFECSPRKAYYPYWFTVEFNPNRLTDEQLNQVFAIIRRALGLNVRGLMRQAMITRIDINIDFALDLRGLLVEVADKRGGMSVMRKLGGTANLGTLYVGSEDADRRLRMYDKRQKNLVDILKPHAEDILAALESHTAIDRWPIKIEDLRKKASAPPLWRMEIVNQPPKGLPILRLDDIAACFDRVRLLNLPTDVVPFNDDTGRLFLLAASLAGLPAALKQLDRKANSKFKNALAERPPVEWWNSKRYATLIRLALQRLKPILPVSAGQRPIPIAVYKPAAAVPSNVVTPPRRQPAQLAQKRVQATKHSVVKSATTVPEKMKVHRIG
jgi:hypothetical protein